MWLVILLGVLIVAAVWLVSIYNSFITLVNQTKSAWADIDVQLKRRYDLIPNLVESVKGYAKHESATFEKITQARAQALNAQTVQEKEAADNQIQGALKTIFAVAENYPELKASQNFSQLQEQLSQVESDLQSARRFYNGSVRDLNTKIEMFPYNVIANMFGIKRMDFFEVDNAAEKQPVKVSF